MTAIIVRYQVAVLLPGTLLVTLGLGALGLRLLIAPVPIERSTRHALVAGLICLTGLALAARVALLRRSAPDFLACRGVGGHTRLLGGVATVLVQIAVASVALALLSYALVPGMNPAVGPAMAGCAGVGALTAIHRIRSSWIAVILAIAVAIASAAVFASEMPSGYSGYPDGLWVWGRDPVYWKKCKILITAVCLVVGGTWLVERRG